MMVASGTSTPTSITVVATSICFSPDAKRAIAASLSVALHAAMNEIDFVHRIFGASSSKRSCAGGKINFFGFVDQGTDPIGALAVRKRAADRVFDLGKARQGNRAGIDRLAAGRFLAQFGDIHVAEISEYQRAWNRRGGEHQHIHRLAFLREREPLVHAEAVLLVDDRQCKIVKGDVFLKKRVGADQEIDIAEGKTVEDLFASGATLAAGENGDTDAGGFRQRCDRSEMLARKNFCWRHERGLAAGLDHRCSRSKRDDGFS